MKSICIYIILIGISGINSLWSYDDFDSLSYLQEYTSRYPEFPNSDDNTYRNPYYVDFHKRYTQSSLIAHAWSFITHQNMYTWRYSVLKKLLDEYNNDSRKFSAVRDIVLHKDHKLIVLSNVHGSLHSVSRILTDLYKRHIIKDDLTIAEPDTYIIFNGNAVNLSPYSLELLTLILQLKKKNPDHFLYVKGFQERYDHWLDGSLKKDLQTRSRSFYIGGKEIPLYEELSQFFDSLPDICNMRVKDTQNTLSITDKKERALGYNHIKAILVSENNQIVSIDSKGLKLISEQDHPFSVWYSISSPVAIYRMEKNKQYDSYVQVQVRSDISSSFISSFFQELGLDHGFKEYDMYTLVGGYSSPLEKVNRSSQEAYFKKAFCVRKDKPQKEIVMGCPVPLTKGVSTLGKAVRQGVSLAVNMINNQGGIHGRVLRVIFMDDEYNTRITKRVVKEFIERYNSSLILSPLGTPTLSTYLDLLQADKAFVFFPVTGASQFRKSHISNIIHWRASYFTEALIATYHLQSRITSDMWGFYYQDDSFGESPLAGAMSLLDGVDNIDIIKMSYQPNRLNSTAFVNKIIDNKMRSIGLFATPNVALDVIKRVPTSLLSDTYVYGTSDLGDPSFLQPVRKMGVHLTVPQAVPHPSTSSLRIARVFQKQSRNNMIPFNPFAFEGYISTMIASEILKQSLEKYDSLSHESIKKIYSSFDNFNYQGLMLTYNPQTHELADFVWIDDGSPIWKKYSLQDIKQ
jgi:ABC-type branched-subunit amino acid transport system substrate-binding protein